MATSMCGMDTLVFTAGIGEHAPAVRAGVVDRLAFMGVKMDHARNALRGDGAWCLSAKDSKVKIFVIPTDEEFMMLPTSSASSAASNCKRGGGWTTKCRSASSLRSSGDILIAIYQDMITSY